MISVSQMDIFYICFFTEGYCCFKKINLMSTFFRIFNKRYISYSKLNFLIAPKNTPWGISTSREYYKTWCYILGGNWCTLHLTRQGEIVCSFFFRMIAKNQRSYLTPQEPKKSLELRFLKVRGVVAVVYT